MAGGCAAFVAGGCAAFASPFPEAAALSPYAMAEPRVRRLRGLMTAPPVAAVVLFSEEDRIEVELRPGFGRRELDVVRGLPGRQWDGRRKVWTAPRGREALTTLALAFGRGGIVVEVDDGDELDTSDPPPDPTAPLLDRVRHALTLRGYSPRTRKVYLGQIRRFLEWCREGGGATREEGDVRNPEGGSRENRGGHLLENPAERARAYILELIERRGISKSYQNQVVSALRFLCETVLGRPALALRIPRPRKETRLPAVLSRNEVARLIERARNPKHRAILALLYSSGLRVGEVVRLRPGDLDAERRLLRVRGGKGDKDRYTLLARRALKVVAVYRAAYPSDRWLFPGGKPGRHLTARSVQRVVKRAARDAGIEKTVTAHTLRHSFATHLLESGTNLRIIQELLGHKSARTTQVYTRVTTTELGSVRSPLDQLPGPGD